MNLPDITARPWWHTLATTALAATMTLGLTGCEVFDDDDDAEPEPPIEIGEALARFVHAVSDAPDVNVNGDGAPLFTNIAFKADTGFATVDAVSTDVTVDAITAGGVATVVGPLTLALQDDREYTVVAVGSVADDTLDALLIDNAPSDVTAGNVRAQVVHAASAAPTVDVFVTAPGADISMAAPLTSFSFGEFTGQVEVPEGDYQIRVTLQGQPDQVVFDSGTVALPAGLDLTILAVNNTLTGEAPISLIVLDASATVSSFEILDIDTPTSLRVVHVSPDAPAVDVIVNDDFDNPAVEDLPYPDATGFLSLPIAAGDSEITINVKVTPFDNPGVIVNGMGMGDDVTLARGEQYTVLATGLLADFQLLALLDDDRSVATDARVRIVHGSPAAGPVDIYVTAPGADITTETPAFTNVPFRADTGYVPLPPGQYDVTVTPTGTTDAAIGPLTVDLEAGGVYGVIARDAAGGGLPLDVILLDDFVAPL
jgi:hypothetical protein